MAKLRRSFAVLLMLLGVVTARTVCAQMPLAGHDVVVRDANPGFVNVNTSQRSALDELARVSRVTMLYWHFFDWRGPVPRSAVVRVPEGVDGVNQLARAAGYTIRRLAPQVLLADSSGCSTGEPVVITARLVPDMGGSVDASIPLENLEWELLRTAWDSVRNNVHPTLFGSPWIATYYWPTREGHGREFYVQQQSTSGLSVNGPPQRYLRKVSVEVNGGTLEVKDLWTDERGTEPQARIVSGPVSELDLDFDGDGVVDVVCFSGVRGEQFGNSPLIVLSGRTGDEIGRLNGYEFVITEDASAHKKITTLGREGYRHYEVDNEGQVTLRDSAPLDDEGARPLLQQAKAGKGTVSTLGLKADDHVVADFVLPHRPANLISHALQELKVLTPIGERMSLPPGGVKQLQGARVLLDYRPKPMEPAVPAPR